MKDNDGGKVIIRISVYSILISIASMLISHYADLQTEISLNSMKYETNRENIWGKTWTREEISGPSFGFEVPAGATPRIYVEVKKK